MYYFMHKGQDALHSRRRQVLRPERRAPPLADRHAALLTRQAHRKGAQAPGVFRRQAPHHLASLLGRGGLGGGQGEAQKGAGSDGDGCPLGFRERHAALDERGEQLLGDGTPPPAAAAAAAAPSSLSPQPSALHRWALPSAGMLPPLHEGESTAFGTPGTEGSCR